jgi:UDP-3-O-[3-hydroxymyristoyl] N-acetylglucosamine deacetylase
MSASAVLGPDAVPRRTLAAEAAHQGLGVISGAQVRVTIGPGSQGIRFIPEGGHPIAASAETLRTGPSWAALSSGGASVQIVEHLLAAMAAAGVTDADVRVSGSELPLGDGSARLWADLLGRADVAAIPGTVACWRVVEPLVLRGDQGDQWLAAYPLDGWKLAYVLDRPEPAIGLQRASFDVLGEPFGERLAGARTFALADEAEAALRAGVFRAGDESNVVLIRNDSISDPAALPDGFARHKLLDLLGDLQAAGRPWRGLFIGYNSGHYLNHRLVRRLVGVV